MKTLKFIVDGTDIKLDQTCDIDTLVPDSEKAVLAVFSFSPEWSNMVKVAGFYSMFGKEYPARAISSSCCMIPAEALARRSFKLRIFGFGENKDPAIKTNKFTVTQNGGKT